MNRLLDDVLRAASWHLLGGRRFFSKYASEIARTHQWVFIVGCNNSGTSLLQSILERTQKVSTFPVEGQRYTRVLKRSERRGFERVWTEYLDDLRMTEQSTVGCFPRLLHDWMGALTPPLKEIIVEKTPANAVRMRWLQRVFPRSHFIGLVRNGYAVTEGVIRKGGKTASRGARHWNLVNEIMIDDSQYLDRFLLLPYEDLVGRREEAARQLGRFLAIDEREIVGAMNESYGFTTVNGSGLQPVQDLNRAGLVRLSPAEIEIIRREAAPMLDQFQYLPEPITTEMG